MRASEPVACRERGLPGLIAAQTLGINQKTQQSTAGGSASCDTVTLAAADLSGDRQVTSLDALMILNAVGGR